MCIVVEKGGGPMVGALASSALVKGSSPGFFLNFLFALWILNVDTPSGYLIVDT
jgi:hypothetical protein